MKKKISKKYIQQAAHNSESKLYLKDLPLWNFFKRKTNERRNFEKSQKIKLFVRFPYSGLLIHWVVYYRRFLFLISRPIETSSFAASLMGSIYSKRSLPKGFTSYKKPRVVNSHCLDHQFHACDSKWCNFLLSLWDAVGWQKPIKEKRRKNFDSEQQNMKWFYDEKTWITGS